MRKLGRYEILQELGRGAMGRIFRARDPQIDRIVAVKTIHIEEIAAAARQEYRDRFLREAKAAGRLSHPGIVVIYDAGEDPETHTPFIVMEYIEGQTLEAFVQERGRLLRTLALDLARQIADALDYAHNHGVIHRDIKPSNILVTSDGRAKITDFGVARLAAGALTLTGQVLGTPHFMAPEQLTGEKINGRADLFSLGMILYWMLTGQHAFPGEDMASITFRIVFTDPVPPSQHDPSLGPDFDYVLARVLVKDPADRYATGRELALDLEDMAAAQPLRSRQAAAAPAQPPAAIPAPPGQGDAPPQQPSPTLSIPPAPVTKTEPMTIPPHASAPTALSLPLSDLGRRLLLAGAAFLLIAALVTSYWLLPGRGSPAPATAASGSESPQQEALPASPSSALPTAVLQVEGEHVFREAILYVEANGQPLRQWRLRSSGRPERFSFTVPVVAARHRLQVRVREVNGNFNQARTIEAAFAADQVRTLAIKLPRDVKRLWLGRELELAWKN